MIADTAGSLYVAGGILALSGTRPTTNDVWRSTNGGSTWTVMFSGAASASGPGRRGVSLLVSGAPSQLLWMTGVNTGTTPESTYWADVWSSSDAGSTWGVSTTAAPFGARDDVNGS